jgi:PAS domain-containing protein
MNNRRPKPQHSLSVQEELTKDKANLATLDLPRSTRVIMDALPIGIIFANREGIVTFASEAISTILQRRCPVGQPIELLVGALSLEHPSGKPFHNEELPLIQVIRQGRQPQPEQIIVTIPTGEKRVTRWNATVAPIVKELLSLKSKSILFAVSYNEEIYPRLQLPRRLRSSSKSFLLVKTCGGMWLQSSHKRLEL